MLSQFDTISIRIMDPKKSGEGYSWQAPEYTEHQHGFAWFFFLIILTTATAAITYLIIRDIFAVAIIGFLGLIVGISATHKPKLLQYKIEGNNLTIGEKTYLLAAYKSFSAANEDHMVSITLMPLKRFQLPLTLYASPNEADNVMEALVLKLPHDDKYPDFVDRLAHRLRF